MLVLELGQKERVEHLTFARNGRSLVATGAFGVAIWPELAAGGRASLVSGLEELKAPAQFTHDGKHLFAQHDKSLTRIDFANGKRLDARELWPERSFSFSVSPVEPLVLATRGGTYSWRNDEPDPIALWRTDDLTPTGKVWERDFPAAGGNPVFFRPDGRFVRLGHEKRGWDFLPRLFTYDTASAEPVGKPKPVRGGGRLAADGRWLLSASKHLFVFSPLAGGRAGTIRNDTAAHFTGVDAQPGGRFFAATSNDATVKFYDATTRALTRTFTWEVGRLRSITFSPDGALVAAGSDKGQVVVWDVDL